MVFKRVLLVVLGLTIVALAINSSLFTQTVHPLSTSVAVSKTPLSAPFYIAQDQGFFEKNGLRVNMLQVIGGNNSFKSVINKQAEFGTSSESVLMFRSQQKVPFSTLATFVESNNDVKVILDKRQSIHSVEDLKNKKIAVIKGSASEYFLSLLLTLNKLDINDVTLVPMQANQMLQALKDQKVQAVSTWEPYAFHINKAMEQHITIVDANNIYTLTFNLVSKPIETDESFEKSVRLLNSLKQASTFIEKHPHQAKEIIKSRLGLEQEFIDWVWDDYHYQLSLNKSLLLTIKDEALWASRIGLFIKEANTQFLQFLNPKPLEHVLPSAVSL